MENLKANISKILRSSVIDGPGNRMVIFFQGCQFNCLYCHNSHTIGLCNLCGTCVDICPTQSLHIINNQLVHKESTCNNCDLCIKSCPENSSPFYKQYTVQELIDEILKVRDFISGLTLSGGEVMLQYPFVKELFKAIRQHDDLKDLSLFIDSNGDVNQNAWEEILPYTDGFMIDVKAATKSSHEKLTGKTNQKVLDSIQYLNSCNKLYEIRTVIVPNFNDSKEEIEALKNIYQTLSPQVRKVIIKMREHGIRAEHNSLSSPSYEEMAEVLNLLDTSGVIMI